MSEVEQILLKKEFSRKDIVNLLSAKGNDKELLLKKSVSVKEKSIGNTVYFRGLIELSNICAKNCFYCGIRKYNKLIARYNLKDEEVITAAIYAYENDYGSIAIQSGELSNSIFTERIEKLLKKIHKETNHKLGVTLSVGEQPYETYKRWFDAGAHRYLLRIEASDPDLYKQIHPKDGEHLYENRIKAIKNLQDIGYQTGTGVMIGFPGQTLKNLADDLLFIKDMDIDMVGMGPYIEHEETPMFKVASSISLEDRLELSIKMIAVLRLMMNNINMASTTALQAISSKGRERALLAGANILMPNITPGVYRENYALYDNKPGVNEEPEDSKNNLENMVYSIGHMVGYGEQGNSKHFRMRQ